MVYAHIMLNALTQSKCSKLCRPNMLEPIERASSNCLISYQSQAILLYPVVVAVVNLYLMVGADSGDLFQE